MSDRPDALERNVRALLRRSYVPALPAPPFRDRLEALFLGEVERGGAARRRAGVGSPRSGTRARSPARLATAFALAAALLALFLGWRLFTDEAVPSRAGLLARGEVALELTDGAWRAADEEERVHGLRFAPPALVVVTPADAGLDVLVAAGRVHVDERSELALRDDGHDLLATLRSGSAWFQRGDERSALAPGVSRSLRAPEPAPASPLASTDEGAPREAVEPALSPAPISPAAARTLVGTVVAAADGAPLSAFTVALLPDWGGNEFPPPDVRQFTSPDGTFRWPDPPTGLQRVFVHAPGYALCALGGHDFGGGLPELRAELVPGLSVRGSVLDAEGNPVPDALVLSENEAPIDGLLFSLPLSVQNDWLPIQTRTGPDGRFELAHLNPGKHTLRADAPGFAPSWKERVSLPRADETELVFTLGPGGTVEGTVTRADGGPCAGAEIVVVAMDQVERARMSFAYAETDAAGFYRLEHLPEMTMIVVRVRSEGRPDPEVSPVQVVEGETVVANFGASLRGARLFGRVLARNGAPLGSQNVGLFEAETASWNQDWVATTTRADGAYEFSGVRPGRYLIYLIDDMGRGLRCVDEVRLAPGQLELEHEVRLPDGRLSVTVYDARSAQPAEALLIVSRIEDDGRSTFSAYGLCDAVGSFAFAEMRAGTYQVVAYPTQGNLGFATSERVELGPDAPVALELGLEEGGQVDVVVRDMDGHPLEKAAVVFTDEAGVEHLFSRLPMTDAAGRYRAQGVRPGRYRVVAHMAGHQGTPVEFRFELGRELVVPIVLAPAPPR